MIVRSVAVLFLVASALADPAAAEVKSLTPVGFEVVETLAIQAPAERVYTALGQVGRWWGSDHTFSGQAANLSIDLRAGGCFCERLKGGGSVEHLTVVYAAPGEGVRLRGALGPLQIEGVTGALTWTLKTIEGGTSLTQSYVVGGYLRGGMDQWAPKVDGVLHAQLRRLKHFVETGAPE